jgi:hypothetical protein
MAVYCAQFVNGELSGEEYEIAPHFDGQTDEELLAAKYKGAREKGWKVRKTATGFRATKRRWGEDAVERVFRIG